MPQFVGEYGFHFLGLQTAEQGVEEDDALGLTEAGEVGVAVRRTLRAVHHEQPGRITSYNVCYTKLLRDDEIAGSAKELEGKTEMDALIAYLQGLGLELKGVR